MGDGQWSLLGLLARARRATSMASTGSWMLPPRARSRASPGLSRRESAPDCREVEVGVHVEVEGAVRVDVGPEQGREGSTVIVGQALGPLGVGEHFLDEQGVDVNERRLQEVQREHRDFLVFAV